MTKYCQRHKHTSMAIFYLNMFLLGALFWASPIASASADEELRRGNDWKFINIPCSSSPIYGANFGLCTKSPNLYYNDLRYITQRFDSVVSTNESRMDVRYFITKTVEGYYVPPSPRGLYTFQRLGCTGVSSSNDCTDNNQIVAIVKSSEFSIENHVGIIREYNLSGGKYTKLYDASVMGNPRRCTGLDTNCADSVTIITFWVTDKVGVDISAAIEIMKSIKIEKSRVPR